MAIKKLIKSAFRLCGMDLRHYRPQSSEDAMMARLLATHAVDCVFDVGANAGQYARQLRAIGFKGRIVSFEPLPEAHAALSNNSRRDHSWTVAPAMALGSTEGEAVIHVSRNLVSSSMREMTDLCLRAAPKAQYVREEIIRIQRLDSVFAEYIADSTRPLLKVDTQGCDSEVLDGADSCLCQFVGVQAEMSLAELYQGQTLLVDFILRMEREGFGLAAVFPGFVDDRSGHLLQVDGVFFRPLSSVVERVPKNPEQWNALTW